MAYEIIDTESIYEGKVLDLSLTRFKTPTRGEVDIEIVHHNGGAAALPVFADGTIALVRQWRYAIGKHLVEIPAGRIENGHTPEQTAARELEEELGYRSSKLEKLAAFFVAPGYCDEMIHVYLATDLVETSQNFDDDEEIEIIRLSLDDAMGQIETGEIEDSKTIIALMKYSGIANRKP